MIKKIKILFWVMIVNLLQIELLYAATREVGNSSIKSGLINISNDNIVQDKQDDGLGVLSSISVWIKDSLGSLVMLIAIGVFLVLGARLAIARGNPEEFKKAILQLVYAVVGIFIVALAWAAVTLVAGINL